MAETEPKWRKGTDKTTCGKQAVVTDCHPGCKCDTDTIEAYGGHLICESVETKYRGLIAAAPDMLEALKNLENDDGSIPQHAWKMVKAAIAKAES